MLTSRKFKTFGKFWPRKTNKLRPEVVAIKCFDLLTQQRVFLARYHQLTNTTAAI